MADLPGPENLDPPHEVTRDASDDKARRVGWRHEWGTLALLWFMVIWGTVTVATGGFGPANLAVMAIILVGGGIGSLVIVDAAKIPMRVAPPQRSARGRGPRASDAAAPAVAEVAEEPEPEEPGEAGEAEPEVPEPEEPGEAEPEAPEEPEEPEPETQV